MLGEADAPKIVPITQNGKGRIELLPLLDPPLSVPFLGAHFLGYVRLRAPPGGMSARSRAGSLFVVKRVPV